MPFITNRIRRPDQLPRMAKVLNVDFANALISQQTKANFARLDICPMSAGRFLARLSDGHIPKLRLICLNAAPPQNAYERIR